MGVAVFCSHHRLVLSHSSPRKSMNDGGGDDENMRREWEIFFGL
jgi:hypothetical protein